MNGLGLIKRKISAAKEIAVSGHVNPDGDSIGSLLSLGLGLESLNKRVQMLSVDGVPQKYTGLPGAKRIVTKITRPADLAITVDCSNKEILGSAYGMLKGAKDILEIDHHEFRRPFGNIKYIEPKAAAVGELIYRLLKKLNINITNDIAQNLLTSVIVETDSFRLPNVSQFTFEVSAELIKSGVDFYRLVNTVFWATRKESAVLAGICLSRCKFLKANRIVWSIIRQSDFRKIRGKDEDVDAVADQMRAIKDVEIAVLLREKKKGLLRVSLRSKDKVNIAQIAEYYGGGGHFDVAGCTIPDNPKIIRQLLAMAKKLL
ncbi:MAG: DHH family phosphoesterase [Candidatus Omnitrophota bacterium]